MDNNTVKQILGSLLLSTNLRTNVRQLCRDYENTEGRPIPYRENGFDNVESFLKSMSDTFTVVGNGLNAEVLPIIKENSSHVHKLVQKQRIPKCSKASQRRKIFSPRRSYYNSFSNVPTSSHINNVNIDKKNTFITNEKVNFSVSDKNTFTTNEKVNFAVNDKNTLTTNEKVNFAVNNKNTFITNEKPKGTVEVLRIKHDEDVYKVENFVEKKCKVPDNVIKNLESLVDSYPDGIFCSKLPGLYCKMFGETLSHSNIGYPSLIIMCRDLNIFYIEQPGFGDYKIYSKKYKKPKSKNLLRDEEDSESKEALPEIEKLVDYFNYPENVLKFGDEIPREWIPNDVKTDQCLDITVTEVYDPSKFWIVIRVNEFNKLMDDLQSFYKQELENYRIPKVLIKVGLICVAILFSEYHRVVIINNSGIKLGKIKVFAFDYGTVIHVSINEVFYMHKKFAKLPQQAIKARLANVYPPVEKTPWSHQACTTFCNYVRNKKLVAKISNILEHNILELCLVDTQQNICINDAMVKDKVAILTSQRQKKWEYDPDNYPIVDFIYLLPLFEELEHGLSFTYNEKLELEMKSTPLTSIYPKYYINITNNVFETSNINMLTSVSGQFYETKIHALASEIPVENEIFSESIDKLNDSISDKMNLSASGTTKIKNFKQNISNRTTLLPSPITSPQQAYEHLHNHHKNYNNCSFNMQPSTSSYGNPSIVNSDILESPRFKNSYSPNSNTFAYPNVNMFNNIPYSTQERQNLLNHTSVNSARINNYINIELSPDLMQSASLNIAAQSSHMNRNRNSLNSLQPKKAVSFDTKNSIELEDESNKGPNNCNIKPKTNPISFLIQKPKNYFSPATNLVEEKIVHEELNKEKMESKTFGECDLNFVNSEISEIFPNKNDVARKKEMVHEELNEKKMESKTFGECDLNCIKSEMTDTFSNKHITKKTLNNKSVHVISYENDKYVIINEILYNYGGCILPVSRIVRHIITTEPNFEIKCLNLKKESQIMKELENYHIIKEWNLKHVIHLIYAKKVLEFLYIFGITLDIEIFNEFLSDINSEL